MGHGSKLRRGFVEDGTPELTKEQSFARITELRGKGIVAVTLPGETELTPALAYLPPKFRGVLYLRRGAFVVVSPLDGGDSIQKVNWSIETLLRNEDIKQPSIFEPSVNIPPTFLPSSESSDGLDDEEEVSDDSNLE